MLLIFKEGLKPQLHLAAAAGAEKVPIVIEYPVGNLYTSINVTAGEIVAVTLPLSAALSG
jgi:hypothetical protein